MKDFNEKCAQYLGWTKTKQVKNATQLIWWTDNTNNDYFDLKFNSDWNWIMLIIKEIMEECFNGDTNESFEDYYYILDAIPNLEKTTQAIYNYITNNE